jgi:hypothetical protein
MEISIIFEWYFVFPFALAKRCLTFQSIAQKDEVIFLDEACVVDVADLPSKVRAVFLLALC